MLNGIISFSIKNKFIVILATIAIILWGGYSFSKLPIDAIPDITNNQAQILTVCPNLATQEVEQFITYPIETAVRTIPGVIELRSISRFGLSVVTVVFDESVDKYLVRQLISEKLKIAEAQIPSGFGTPELAPISTGLGEILHYRIEAKPGFENRYSSMDLRTIQDWIVKRQLAGIPGVVEVNSFGGYLRQYEVAVTPSRLKALGVGISEVVTALESANENSGGAYIENNSSVYFIRSEGLAKSIEDIRQIVVRPGSGAPVRIADIGEVRLGSALRYGAVSHNGKGEIVLGIVMMLKGENAANVIRSVKQRMIQIESSLPEGVTIKPFLDRENLVNRTIRTVQQNLVEGALIVIFVLVLLVGNFRAGVIIASVIPLSMMFAVGMMQLTGVSANLMSLGAIDFGLIIDGAVIIVESTLHFLGLKLVHHRVNRPEMSSDYLVLSQTEMDENVRIASSKIMRSSVFGVLIILIVYLPILSLTGVEGKMFRPMAETVGYALIGALMLSLTYVPAVSAMFLSKKIKAEKTLADRILLFFRKSYAPVLIWSLKWRKTVLSISAAMLFASVLIFMNLGGEFIPELDEGDLLIHGFLRPGTSLSQTLESHRLLQEKLIKNFPDEVEEVISKIGSAEIPTDPMAIETADNVILLKPRKNWTKASTKDELIEMMQREVHEIPGMAFEFTQPIKMRFDEMMTGVRSDIAVKIFGDNLEILAQSGQDVQNIIRQVPGLADLKVEQIEGLPQIVARYNYSKLAQYGLSVKEVNAVLGTAFAGATAGSIFEDERSFDLVVRMDSSFRKDILDVEQLPVKTVTGELIPLGEIAEIDYQLGAAQISRDDGRRRIVVSANVKGRDIEGAINDIQQILKENLKLPAGYFLTYGGQFENLQAAKTRLSIAVPVALILIFLMLYFAFKSLKESVLIFTAIPMAAIGGVISLSIRDMPFSISAGVGFIALFGVAVLNGIVLISYFNQLEKEGVENITDRIIRGALVRLRPVLMTAAVASMGFLPMAISQGAGAEVQKPLATVVIGGLVTSTLLTMVVLPVLYSIFFRARR